MLSSDFYSLVCKYEVKINPVFYADASSSWVFMPLPCHTHLPPPPQKKKQTKNPNKKKGNLRNIRVRTHIPSVYLYTHISIHICKVCTSVYILI